MQDAFEFPAGLTPVSKIGQGGMGEVFLVRREADGARLVMKRVRPDLLPSQGAKDRFIREVEVLQNLRHEHIVGMVGAELVSGAPCYWMEYCEGGDAADLATKRGGRMEIDEAILIILDVLEGLEYLATATVAGIHHADGATQQATGIVHRDMKPENILLVPRADEGWVAKVADFGLSKAFETAGYSGFTGTGSIGGTFRFMSRRQLINFKYATPEVDVWSAAASLYFLLTGSTPREWPLGMSGDAVVATKNPVPILQRRADLPDGLAGVVDKALAGDEEPAFARAADLRRALVEAWKG